VVDDEDAEIGRVIGGGLSDNLIISLDIPIEQIRVGDYLMVEGELNRYYAAVVDLDNKALSPQFIRGPRQKIQQKRLAALVKKHTLLGTAEIALTHSYPRDDTQTTYHELGPAQTIPPLQSSVVYANGVDLSRVFGDEDNQRLVIGHTHNQEHPIAINLAKLVQRSTGIFGASGSGKSYLTRQILAGLIEKKIASLFILDIHNDYGFRDQDENGRTVPGLTDLYPGKVHVYGLGNMRVRGHKPDAMLMLSYADFEPADLELIRGELSLTDTAPLILDQLVKSFGDRAWFSEFARMAISDPSEGQTKVAEWAKRTGVRTDSAEALRRKINRLIGKGYLREGNGNDVITEIIHDLEAGTSVIVSYGSYNQPLDQMLVGNILTRRIAEAWQSKSDNYRSTGKDEPPHLAIVVEEAHRFLSPSIESQTTFGTLAREMRKSSLTLLIVDQRPSKIDDEVISQLGTRIICGLSDDDDIQAVLGGVRDRDNLRRMIRSLAQSQEAVISGWGTPMPISFRVCEFFAGGDQPDFAN
jgi:uncharacterized protein